MTTASIDDGPFAKGAQFQTLIQCHKLCQPTQFITTANTVVVIW